MQSAVKRRSVGSNPTLRVLVWRFGLLVPPAVDPVRNHRTVLHSYFLAGYRGKFGLLHPVLVRHYVNRATRFLSLLRARRGRILLVSDRPSAFSWWERIQVISGVRAGFLSNFRRHSPRLRYLPSVVIVDTVSLVRYSSALREATFLRIPSVGPFDGQVSFDLVTYPLPTLGFSNRFDLVGLLGVAQLDRVRP